MIRVYSAHQEVALSINNATHAGELIDLIDRCRKEKRHVEGKVGQQVVMVFWNGEVGDNG
jgi:hypothetical protein